MKWTPERLNAIDREYDQYRLLMSQGDDSPLHHFLYHCTIDSKPDPLPFCRVYRPWQWERIKRRAPMVEYACGYRPDYKGDPQNSWETWPRGHDKTGETARICVWAAAFARKPIKGTVVASDGEQAALLFDAAKTTIQLNPWLKEKVGTKGSMIEGDGGHITIRTHDAAGSYGLTDDLTILDELTHWQSRALWDTLISGSGKVPTGAMLVMTNAGVVGSWQWDILQDALDDPLWRVYQSPPKTILADWMTMERIESIRRKMSASTARRVWDNEWVDATDLPLLTFDEILSCEDWECLWTRRPESFAYRPELYMGVDVGRTNDLTVIWTLEQVRDVSLTREIKTLSNASFQEQRFEIESRLTRDVISLSIDMGAIGYQLSEDLHAAYPHQVNRVALSAGRQGQLGIRVREAFRERSIRIPSDPVLRRDLQQVSAVETGTGGTPLIRTDRSDVGHADRFWAMALALGGVPTRATPKSTGGYAMAQRSRFASQIAGTRRRSVGM